MQTSQILISTAAAHAISALAQGVQLSEVALEALRTGLNDLTPEQKHTLQELAAAVSARVDSGEKESLTPPAPTATAQGVEVLLNDNRPGVGPHKAYLFAVSPSQGTVKEDLIAILGEVSTERLIRQLGRAKLLESQLTTETHVALFLDSNNKPYDQDYANPSHTTTQSEDFRATGFTFADEPAALLLCARVMKKAVDGVQEPSEAEVALLDAITRGVVRTTVNTLGVDKDGKLCALGFFGPAYPFHWALGLSVDRK